MQELVKDRKPFIRPPPNGPISFGGVAIKKNAEKPYILLWGSRKFNYYFGGNSRGSQRWEQRVHGMVDLLCFLGAFVKWPVQEMNFRGWKRASMKMADCYSYQQGRATIIEQVKLAKALNFPSLTSLSTKENGWIHGGTVVAFCRYKRRE